MLRAVAGTGGWPVRTAALRPEQVAALLPPTEPAAAPVPLTPADDKLLAALAKDGRAGVPALAAATGWSETTVRRRVEQLRHAGVLYFDVEIEPALFGHTAEAALWLTVEPSALTAVGEALATHPQVAFAAAITGPATVAASLVCRDLDELYEYIATGIGSLGGVSRAETAPVVRRVKDAGALLVGPA